MTPLVVALNHYRPQIKFGRTADWKETADLISAMSTVTRTDVIGVLTGLQDAVVYFNSYGRGVKLEGLGTYLPNINYKGELDVAHRLDRGLKRALNRSFNGTILNKKHIGRTVEEVVALWNAEHPDDPVIY